MKKEKILIKHIIVLNLLAIVCIFFFLNCSSSVFVSDVSVQPNPPGLLPNEVPDQPNPKKLSGNRVVVGDGITCALIKDQVYCWGIGQKIGPSTSPSSHTLLPKLIISSGATEVKIFGQTACALVRSSLECWGALKRVFGDGFEELRTAPLVFLEYNVTDFAIGNTHICAIQNAKVFCRGYGYFGDDDKSKWDQWQQIDLPTSQLVAASNDKTCVIAENDLFCWGVDFSGAFGAGSKNVRFLNPQKINLPPEFSVSNEKIKSLKIQNAGNFVCLQTQAGSFFCSGEMLDGSQQFTFKRQNLLGLEFIGNFCQIISDQARCRASSTNYFGVFGPELNAQKVHDYVVGSGNIEWISESSEHACLVQDGKIKCWGRNNYGQLGNGTTSSKSSPVLISGVNEIARMLSFTLSSFCALINEQLKCWGLNHFTKDNVSINGYMYLPTIIGNTASLPSVERIYSTPNTSSLAYKSSNVLKFLRTLNFPYVGDFIELVQSPNEVAIGWGHVCISKNGTLRCAGSNISGQLGDGTDQSTIATKLILQSGVSEVSATHSGTCAIHNNEIYCWGSPYFGASANSNLPIATGILNSSNLQSSMHSVCYLKEKKLFCDGNIKNVLGANAVTPILENVDSYSLSDQSICAIRERKLLCAGDNTFGQLGQGIFDGFQTSWFQLSLNNVTEVAVSNHTHCAIAESRLYCWGRNENGEVGDGSAISTNPVEVQF